jgi:hypothetical protein
MIINILKEAGFVSFASLWWLFYTVQQKIDYYFCWPGNNGFNSKAYKLLVIGLIHASECL